VQLNLNKVLQDIGVVTRMEGVAVAEHRDSNLVDAVPAVRSLVRANRHYPSDTPSTQQTRGQTPFLRNCQKMGSDPGFGK
jgi:hypothetical protein